MQREHKRGVGEGDEPEEWQAPSEPTGGLPLNVSVSFCCTDLSVSVAFILPTYACRWTLEVTFFLLKGLLGFEEPQNRTEQAVRRTVPFAGLVFALIVLWYAAQLQAGRAAPWLVRPWSPVSLRRKVRSSFADVLATLRYAGVAAAATWRSSVCDLTPDT